MRGLPDRARRLGGYALGMVQLGLIPRDWKAIPLVGPGVMEIRVRTGREFRIIYVATYPEAVYVLHVFEKKTQRISWADLEIARRRLVRIKERA